MNETDEEPRALVKDASDPDQIKAARRKERRATKDDLEDMREVLRTDPGRRVIWDLLEYCGVFESSWVTGKEIYLLQGKREVGLKILSNVMKADEGAFLEMMGARLKKK